MNKKIVFIGGIGANLDFGGELTKNKYLIDKLKSSGYEVITIDTYQSRRKFWKLFKIPYLLISNPGLPLILSTSFGNIYPLIKILHIIRTRRNITYFCIGGILHERVLSGEFKSKYFDLFDQIYVEGKKMKDGLLRCGIRSVVLPNFKDISYLPDLSRFKQTGSHVNFVFVSRICKEKGVTLILEASKLLEGYSDHFSVSLYGQVESGYENEFKSLLPSLKNVKYNGVLDLRSEAGYNELASYDIMLFPTFWKGEGFPGVLIDALISGLPIIASDWNFNEDIIENDKNGLIIPNQNLGALYDAMLFAIHNRDKFYQMSETCQKMAKIYDVNVVLNDALIGDLALHKYNI